MSDEVFGLLRVTDRDVYYLEYPEHESMCSEEGVVFLDLEDRLGSSFANTVGCHTTDIRVTIPVELL
jgi:hypothetical protein